MIKINKILIFTAIIFVFTFNICLAQNSLITPEQYSQQSSDKGCIKTGDCELNDFVRIAIVVSEIILGIVGSLALLAFVAGGVMFLISAGNQERVTQAKQIILGAVIGLVIVFTSFMIIQFVYTALGIKGNWYVASWFSNSTGSQLTQTRQECYNAIYAQMENCIKTNCPPSASPTSPCVTTCINTYDTRSCDSLPQ